MKILAVESSCDIASVSLLEDNNLILELKEFSTANHSEALMPLIDKLLKKTNTSLDDISLFAVDNRPRFFYWNQNWTCNHKSILWCKK